MIITTDDINIEQVSFVSIDRNYILVNNYGCNKIITTITSFIAPVIMSLTIVHNRIWPITR